MIFSFDHVFDAEDSTEDLYSSVKDLVEKAVNGENATIFLYGQTGSGKTYTMRGNYKVKGIIELAEETIWDIVEKTDNTEFSISLAAYELYNEDLFYLQESKNTKVLSYKDFGRKRMYIQKQWNSNIFI